MSGILRRMARGITEDERKRRRPAREPSCLRYLNILRRQAAGMEYQGKDLWIRSAVETGRCILANSAFFANLERKSCTQRRRFGCLVESLHKQELCCMLQGSDGTKVRWERGLGRLQLAEWYLLPPTDPYISRLPSNARRPGLLVPIRCLRSLVPLRRC